MPCIYQIKNLVNDKSYIGSTQNALPKRQREHLAALRGGYHFNKHLQSAWLKYGEKNFLFELVEDVLIPKEADIDIYRYVTDKELGYIKLLNPSYNIARETRGGRLGRVVSEEERIAIGNRSRGRKCSPETIQKIKEARSRQVITEETKRRISDKLSGTTYQKGRRQSIEQRQANSQRILEFNILGIGMHSIESKNKRMLTLKNKVYTSEMKEVLKKSARGRSKIPFLCFKDKLIVGEFLSQADAADTLGLKSSEICAVLRGEQKTTKGYTFNYKNYGELDR